MATIPTLADAVEQAMALTFAALNRPSRDAATVRWHEEHERAKDRALARARRNAELDQMLAAGEIDQQIYREEYENEPSAVASWDDPQEFWTEMDEMHANAQEVES